MVYETFLKIIAAEVMIDGEGFTQRGRKAYIYKGTNFDLMGDEDGD